MAEKAVSPEFGELIRDITGTGEGFERAEGALMASAIASAYKEELKEEAEARVLGKFGLTVEHFLETGLAKFGEHAYHDLLRCIRDIEFDVEFLIAGFNAIKVPQLLSISNPGIVRDHTRLGYSAIGIGGYIAMMSISSHGFTSHRTVEEAVYHSLEAKFMAERAPGVGNGSTLMLQWPGRVEFLSDEAIAETRCLWLGWGKAHVPKRALRSIEKNVRRLRPQLASRKSRQVR